MHTFIDLPHPNMFQVENMWQKGGRLFLKKEGSVGQQTPHISIWPKSILKCCYVKTMIDISINLFY